MAAIVPTTFPTSLRAGDSAAFTIALADYSAAAGYTLTLRIVGSGGTLTSAATASGSSFAFTLTAAQTTALAAGDYAISAQVTLASEAVTVYSARLNVLPNLSTADASTETRSYWRRVRDALRALLEQTAPDPTQAYTIFGERAVTLMTIDDRLKLLATAEGQVAAEDAAAGNGRNRNVYMKFSNAR